MIHILRVLACLLLSAAAVSVAAATDGDLEVLGTCDSETGECMTGHTSLLQNSMRLTGHSHHGARKGAATDSTRADSQKDASQSHGGAGIPPAAAPPAASSKGPHTLWILVAGVMFAVLLFYLVIRPLMAPALATPRDFVHQPEEEMHERMHDSLYEDTYSLAICILVRDLRSLASGEQKPGLKMSRIGFAIALVIMTIGIQISIVICTKQFVTPNQVADIRDAYDKFEQVMYNNHTYLNANGKQRGIPGYFDSSAFDNLSDDEKTAACNIPLSQQGFLFLILTIWSVTCFANLRQNIEMFLACIWCTPTKDDMIDCLRPWDVAKDTHYGTKETKPLEGKTANPIPVMVITGLTATVKAFLIFCVFLPEFCTTSYILWLGSRWLTATNDFGNIVCNAVALEFILQLKYILYEGFASERNKRDLSYTCVAPTSRKEYAGYMVYFYTLVWLTLSGLWVYLYIYHLQHVLPDYKWDVNQVCTSWFGQLFSNSGGDNN